MNRKEHWDHIYEAKAPQELSWFQQSPTVARRMLEFAGATTRSSVIDVGGGVARLADYLLAHGYERVTVLDVSRVALDYSRKRLGSAAERVRGIVGDVSFPWPGCTRVHSVTVDDVPFRCGKFGSAPEMHHQALVAGLARQYS